jgi:teichuronic acid biosynthesis glycosyltransferase TuaC
MRVLVITNLYPNPLQPQRAAANRQHFRALARDHEVKIVAPISWVDELQARLRGARAIPRDRRCRFDGIDVVHPRYFYPPGMLRSRYGRLMQRAIRADVLEVAREFQPDVVLGSWAYPDGYAATQLANELDIPSAVAVLGSDVNLLDQYPTRRSETEKALRAADIVITVSQHLASKVINLGVNASRVVVVYRGVDRDLFSPGSQHDAQTELRMVDADPVLLLIGNLVPVKAIDVFITGCGMLANRFPRMQCHIIGDGPLRKRLSSQAAEQSMSMNIHFHGAIAHDRLPTWYRAADLVVLPSLSEGVPNVLLESIACGRRYVASDTGGIPEISDHAGCTLVAPGDPRALAEAICSRLSDPTTPTVSDLPVASWGQAAKSLAAALTRVTARATQVTGVPEQAIA